MVVRQDWAYDFVRSLPQSAKKRAELRVSRCKEDRGSESVSRKRDGGL